MNSGDQRLVHVEEQGVRYPASIRRQVILPLFLLRVERLRPPLPVPVSIYPRSLPGLRLYCKRCRILKGASMAPHPEALGIMRGVFGSPRSPSGSGEWSRCSRGLTPRPGWRGG